jgi:hypothetical protein
VNQVLDFSASVLVLDQRIIERSFAPAGSISYAALLRRQAVIDW